MKVAVCISGMSRSYQKTAQSILSNLIEPHNADVFISTWKPEEADHKYPDTHPVEGMLDLFKPKKFDIEIFNELRARSFETNDFQTRADWDGAAVRRMLPMFWKIYLAALHKRMYEKENQFRYDVVVRCRSDLQFNAPVKFETPAKNTVYFPKINLQNGVNDQLWYSDSETADAIGMLYQAIPELWHQGVIIHGESLLYYFLASMKIYVMHIDIDYNILR